MNFSAVQGYNAYAAFNAKIRDFVRGKNDSPAASDEAAYEESNSLAVYSEPVDIVTISEKARRASETLIALRENAPHNEFREWARTRGMMRGNFSQEVSGSTINKALSGVLPGSGLSVGDDEAYTIEFDIMSTINVSGRNAEKAKAIQELLSTTPFNINWGLLLTNLPPG